MPPVPSGSVWGWELLSELCRDPHASVALQASLAHTNAYRGLGLAATVDIHANFAVTRRVPTQLLHDDASVLKKVVTYAASTVLSPENGVDIVTSGVSAGVLGVSSYFGEQAVANLPQLQAIVRANVVLPDFVNEGLRGLTTRS